MAGDLTSAPSRASRAAARLAVGFGIFLAVAETARNWGDWQWWPFWLVDFIAAALLVAGGRLTLRGRRGGNAVLCGAWGFATAIFYASFFSHVEDFHLPAEGNFDQGPLTVAIGLLWVVTIAGLGLALVGARRPEEEAITWKIRLRASPETVYDLLATVEGRERFWAEEAPEVDGAIRFRFPGGERLDARILERVPGRRFAFEYFDRSRAVFELEERPDGGCDLTLRESGLSPETREQNAPGWVSVLLSLKAAADFGVDLRNHAPEASWAEGFVDN